MQLSNMHQIHSALSTKKGPYAVIMFSEHADFTPNFYHQYFFHTKLELVDSYSDTLVSDTLDYVIRLIFPWICPEKCKNMFPLPEVLFHFI